MHNSRLPQFSIRVRWLDSMHEFSDSSDTETDTNKKKKCRVDDSSDSDTETTNTKIICLDDSSDIETDTTNTKIICLDDSSDETDTKKKIKILLDNSDNISLVTISDDYDSGDSSTSLPSLFDNSDVYDNDSSNSYEIDKNKYKWCVCENGSNGSNPKPKMCEKCNQWYHLECLPKSYREINNNSIDLVCPVCNADKVFIQKYSSKINLRRSRNKSSTSGNSNAYGFGSRNTSSSDNENTRVRKKLLQRDPRKEKRPERIQNILKSSYNTIQSIDRSPIRSPIQTFDEALAENERLKFKKLSVHLAEYKRLKIETAKHKSKTLSFEKIPENKKRTRPEQYKDTNYYALQIQRALQERYDEMDFYKRKQLSHVNIEQLSETIADEIDRQNDYDKARTFYFNLRRNISRKTNTTFYLKILNGQIKPNELPKMSIYDMDDNVKANLKKQNENNLNALIEYNKERAADKMKPRYKKTKKGEEPIETDLC